MSPASAGLLCGGLFNLAVALRALFSGHRGWSAFLTACGLCCLFAALLI